MLKSRKSRCSFLGAEEFNAKTHLLFSGSMANPGQWRMTNEGSKSCKIMLSHPQGPHSRSFISCKTARHFPFLVFILSTTIFFLYQRVILDLSHDST